MAETSRSAKAWDDFLETSRPNTGYKQSSWWSDFLTSRNWRHFGAAVSEQDAIVGGARVLVKSYAPGKYFYYVPHGPVLPENGEDAQQVLSAVVSYIDQVRSSEPGIVSHLRFEPRWETLPPFLHGFQPARNWLEPRNTLCVDLTLAPEEILAQMKPKGRYNIRLALRHGVSVVEDNSRQGVDDFFELYDETVRRHEIRSHSKGYFDELTKRLLPCGHASIFFAEFEGMRLATSLSIYHGDTATYKYGGSRTSRRNLMAPYLLHFQAMLKAKALGYRWYDFYGITRKPSELDPWAAITVFKRKFGGREFRFIPPLDRIYDADSYEEYHRRRNTHKKVLD